MMLKKIDQILNNFTMYKVILYGLCLFIVTAFGLSFTNNLYVKPLELVLTTLVLSTICYLSNKLFARLKKVPTNSESWLITALIMVCIVAPRSKPSDLAYVALAGVIAMASKYFITYKKTHIFNPAAFGVFTLSVFNLLSGIWWIATPYLTPLVALLVLAVLRKQRHFQLFTWFTISAVAMLVVQSTVLHGAPIAHTLRSSVTSWPILFFGGIMLTEPSTLIRTKYYQGLVGVVAGLLFTSQLHYGNLATTPQAILVLINVLTVLVLPQTAANLKFKKVNKLSSNIYEAVFTRPENLRFIPGQYMMLTIPHKNVDIRGNRRTFSFASSPMDDEIRIAFRHFDKSSTFKEALLSLKADDMVRLSKVDGDFVLRNDGQPKLLIAGGIGITPFKSMLTSLKDKTDVVLLYAAAQESDFVFKDEFKKAEKWGVKTIYTTDILDSKGIKSLVPDVSNRQAFVSGPDIMVKAYVGNLKKLGAKKIHTDYFSGY